MQFGKPLRVFSTFTSINGEICQAHQGSLCTFIRFAGCNLRCKWCDTVYAQKEDSGLPCSLREIMSRVKDHGFRNITITGGEPFMQEHALWDLLVELEKGGYRVSVETNGSYEFSPFDTVDYVVDYKMPSSGESEKMKPYLPWLELKSTDWIKFVIEDEHDYSTALRRIAWLNREGCVAKFAMSPILTKVSALALIRLLKVDHMSNVVVSVQLHKLLKLDESQ